MGIGARLTAVKLAFLTWLSATRGTSHCQHFFLGDFHGYIMQSGSRTSCSIVTSQRSTESALRHSPQPTTTIADMKLCIK